MERAISSFLLSFDHILKIISSQLPSLSALTNLSEVDISNAETILGDQYSDSMEITAGDINAKFKAAQILIDDAKNNSGGAFDYDACSSYSVNNDINGIPLENSFEDYVNNGLNVSDVFVLSECAQKGCLVDALRETCVADAGDCGGSYTGDYFGDSGAEAGRGLCPIGINDPSGNQSFEAPDCSWITNPVACRAFELGLSYFIISDITDTSGSGTCGLGGDQICYTLSDDTEIDNYCFSLSDSGDISDQDACESSGICTFIEDDGCYNSNNI